MTSSGFSPWPSGRRRRRPRCRPSPATPRRGPGADRHRGHVRQRTGGRRSPRARGPSPGRATTPAGRRSLGVALGPAPSQPTPRTTNSAFPLWTTSPPTAAFDSATASATCRERHPAVPEPERVELDLVLDRRRRRRWPPRRRRARRPSCGRTYQSWMARSRPRSWPGPSTVYQKIWPVAAASGPSRGVTPGGQVGAARAEPLGHPPAGLRRRPPPSSKITLIIEKPTSLDDRDDADPASPLQLAGPAGR